MGSFSRDCTFNPLIDTIKPTHKHDTKGHAMTIAAITITRELANAGLNTHITFKA